MAGQSPGSVMGSEGGDGHRIGVDTGPLDWVGVTSLSAMVGASPYSRGRGAAYSEQQR